MIGLALFIIIGLPLLGAAIIVEYKKHIMKKRIKRERELFQGKGEHISETRFRIGSG
jgi:hypothetical protein